VITIFGESHGKGVGITIDGVPPGLEIDKNLIQYDLNRRRPGQSKISTPRKEKDVFEILSGIKGQNTTGAPLTMFIQNKDHRSKDYSLFRKIHRPSHIDYPAILRYGESVDLRGSGIFSGRLTAPIVMAGGIAKAILKKYGVEIGAFVSQIGNVKEPKSYSVNTIKENVEKNLVRTVDKTMALQMLKVIESVKSDEDSIGGVVSVVIEGFPKGIGNPWFQSLESELSAGIFSIPAVKGIEFGSGFKAAEMRGSEHNDPYVYDEENQEISTKTNHNGGIIGGISIGTPITFNVAVKPTSSIGKTQRTLNFKTKKMADLNIKGRHDPCIVPRALVGIEAMTAVVLVDALLSAKN